MSTHAIRVEIKKRIEEVRKEIRILNIELVELEDQLDRLNNQKEVVNG
jgi:chromosome segregation ATPase